MKFETGSPAAMDKQSFAAFITQKRKYAGMTQLDLASKLFVAHSTVSKWERGLSYPDIALVPAICRELGISEHEFFTACDDIQGQQEQKQAKSWRRMVTGWQWFFYIAYGIALVTCFICNLATTQRLDWFFIVLCSLGLAFSFTSLPLLLRKERLAISLLAATACLLLLIVTCGIHTGGEWLVQGLAILAACLALPWGVYAIGRFGKKQLLPWILAFLTVWTVGLLAVINALSGGSWFVSFALPITLFCYAFVWAIFAVSYWAHINGCLKAAAITTIAAFSLPLSTEFSARLTGDVPYLPFSGYFNWQEGLLWNDTTGNRTVFAALLLVALILLVIGLMVAVRRRKNA